jgi:fatty acid desaturase
VTPQIKELSVPNAFRWLLAIAFDWFVIVGAFIGIYHLWQLSYNIKYILIPFLIVVIAARQHALAIMGHDGAHRLVCRNKKLNDLLTGLFCFWPIGFAINGYRAFHFKHHQTLGTKDDPEKIHTTQHYYLGQWTLPLFLPKLIFQIVTDLFGGGIPHLAMAAKMTKARGFWDQFLPIATVITLSLVLFAFGLWWVLLVWFGSLATAFWAIFRLRLWTEHTIEDENADPTHRLYANWIERFFLQPHNTWCHWEHHYYPQVPQHNLPRLRSLLDGPEIITMKGLIGKLT